MPTDPCPSESRLRDYLLGKGDPAELDEIARHLEGCPDCERLVQNVEEQGETFLGRLRGAFPADASVAPLPQNSADAPAIERTVPEPRFIAFSPAIDPGNLPDATSPAIAAQGGQPSLERGTPVRYFGDYEIRSELGRGGMGVVYKARQVSLDRPVALKMIKAGLLADATDLRRFQNEAEAVALLDHPGIVPVYEIGDHEGQRYFSMKLIEGGNLADRLSTFKATPRAAVNLLIETTEAVQHAHLRGVLHRDLKPANILIDAAGHPHVTDFGLAKRVEGDIDMTATGAVMGTPAYMSPEQASGRRGSITTATDVYGLGAILYALLAGKAPFGGDSAIETLDAVRTRPPTALSKLNAKVPRDLQLIIDKCLEKNPLERYATTGALAADLKRFAAGEPVSVRPAGTFERAAKWARRKPTLATAYTLGLLTVLLGGLGGTAVWQWKVAERAGVLAEQSRMRAVASQGEAEAARGQADRLRSTAELQRERIERIEYGRTIEVARQEWSDNNVAATRELLESTKPELRGWEWYYLDRLAHAYSVEIRGVIRGVLSPDGTRIVALPTNEVAKVWDAKTGAEILSLNGHTKAVVSASFSRDGSRILTISEDNTTKVWNATNGTMICSVPVRHVSWEFPYGSFSPDGSRILTPNNTDDRTTLAEVKVWDTRTGTEIITLKGHSGVVVSASFSPDGTRIVTASEDRQTKIWDARTGVELRTLGAGLTKLSGASFSPNGSRIVTYGDGMNGQLKNGLGTRIWDATTGAELIKMQVDVGKSDLLIFSPDGSRLLFSRYDKAVVYDAATGAEIATIRGHANAINSAAFSPDGARIVTASDDQTARVWDAKTGEELYILRGHADRLHSAAFSFDGTQIVTSAKDMTVKVWEARRTDVLSIETANIKRNRTACFGPDGLVIATAGKVRDAKTGVEIRSLGHNPRNRFNAMAFSPKGTHIIGAMGWNTDFDVCVWDRVTGNICGILRGHSSPVDSVSYSNDGSRILTSSSGVVSEEARAPMVQSEVKVWDAKTGKVIHTIKDETQSILWASFSPDGSRFVTTGNSSTKIWDTKSGELILILKGHPGTKFMASYSPDGSRIITVGDDKTARVWDAATGEELFSLRGHTGGLNSGSFSPDGLRIVTSSSDLTAKVWDAATGTHVLTLKGHRAEVRTASFSPDGWRIITASDDSTVRVWETAPINREILDKRPIPPSLPPSITLASRFPAVLRGNDQPTDFAERVSFALLAEQSQLNASAARWFGELLEANPKLGDDLTGFRAIAAFNAALAAAGRGKDAVPPDEATKTTLRRLAIAWLKADLAVQANYLKTGNVQYRPRVVAALYRIKQAPQLAGIRDPEVLATISEDERKSCEAFWAEVDQLLMNEERVSKLDPVDQTSLVSLHVRAHALVASHPEEAEPFFRWVLEGYRKRMEQGRPEPDLVIELTGDLSRVLEFAGRKGEAEPIRRSGLEVARKYFGKDDARTMNLMALLGSNLVDQNKWAEAEAVYRELLALSEKSKPDDWSTFNSRGSLGACLLGQKKFDEAEPLIVSGYEGMKAREAKIPPEAKPRLTEAAQRAVNLYEAWGKPEKAAEWRAKLVTPADEPRKQP